MICQIIPQSEIQDHSPNFPIIRSNQSYCEVGSWKLASRYDRLSAVYSMTRRRFAPGLFMCISVGTFKLLTDNCRLPTTALLIRSYLDAFLLTVIFGENQLILSMEIK